MDQNKDKQKLNDELLNNVAGGGIVEYLRQDEYKRFLYVCYSYRCCDRDILSDFEISACPYCGSNEIYLVDTLWTP